MNIKKNLLFISIGFAAIIFAVPAAASAAEWKDGGKPITEKINAKFSGPIGFKTALGSYECQAHIPVTLEPEGKGSATGFEFTNTGCKGSGLFEGCTPNSVEVTFKQYKLTLTVIPVTRIDIIENGTLDIHYWFAKGCSVEKLTYTVEELKLTPANGSAIKTAAVSGKAITDISGEGVATEPYGTVEMSPSGTYGIG